MRKIIPFLFLFSVGFFSMMPLVAQSIFINEFMASNTNTYRDGSGAFEDWIELYNDGSTPVNIGGYFLTDDLANLKKHRLSPLGNELVIPAKGFLILWASSNAAKGTMHLGFGLSAGGESLALIAPDGLTVLDSYVFGPQRQDISTGRTKEGFTDWVYFNKPTPGNSNTLSTGYKGFLNAPVFSLRGGFYPSPVQVEISTAEPGATILYTLDGSEPTPDQTGGRVYSFKNSYPGNAGEPFGPLLTDTMRTYVYNGLIPITDKSPAKPSMANKSSTIDQVPFMPPADIFKGTCLRARVIKEGFLPGEIVTQTYFITPQGRSRYNLPVASVVIPPISLFGYREGIYNAGKDFDDWRAKNPTQSPFFKAAANFRREGDSSERVGNWEYFPGPEQVVNQQVGVRIHGSSSTFNRIKSLRLYARAELGKSDFSYPFFKGYPLSSFRRLLFRPDDWERTAIRDMVVQQIGSGLNFDYQQGQASVLFLNGEFWGIHNLRERIDRYYIEGKHGIPEAELDLLEDNAIVTEGSNKNYLELRNFINTKDLTEKQHYDFVQSAMDINSFTDYFIHETFIANRDWPNNNIRFYRKNTPVQPGATGPLDGRWRWILFDTDASYTSVNVEDTTLERVMGIENVLLDKLIKVPAFRNQFIIRYTDLLNTIYVPDWGRAKIDSAAQLIRPVIEEHRRRLLDEKDLDTWTNGIQSMKNFAVLRPVIIRRQLQNLFGLSDTHRITINVSHPERGYVSINTIALKKGTPGVKDQPFPWQGLYFANMPVTLIPQPLPGYRFVKWEGDISTIIDTLILRPEKPLSILAIFEPMPAPAAPELLHYWHFNDLAAGTLTAVKADISVTGNAIISYPGLGAGFMDRVVGEGSVINTHNNFPAGNALRVRNPSISRQVQINIPSTGYKDIEFSWASVRTSSGAQEQRVFYSIAKGIPQWKELSPAISIGENYLLYQYSLKGKAGTENNPDLAIGIFFSGTNASGSSGNNRFDNITVSGIPGVYNCNGSAPQVWFEDSDGDGFSSGIRILQCDAPAGYSLLGQLKSVIADCNDSDPLQYPGARWFKDADNDGYSDGLTKIQCLRPEGYRSADQLKDTTGDCRDNDAALNPETKWYKDADGDGYSDGVSLVQCDRPAGFKLATQLKDTSGDCKDNDPSRNPGTIWYKDADNDGYSDGTTIMQCQQPQAYKPVSSLKGLDNDCNDGDEKTNPETIWYSDADGDRYSNGITKVQCLQPAGFVRESRLIEINTDCNDNDSTIYKGATEIPDGKDNDCDGLTDLGTGLVVSVAPNPVYRDLRVLMNVFMPGKPIMLTLAGADGRVYLQYSLIPVSFGQQILLNSGGFAPGTYFLSAQQGDKRVIHKVLIIR